MEERTTAQRGREEQRGEGWGDGDYVGWEERRGEKCEVMRPE